MNIAVYLITAPYQLASPRTSRDDSVARVHTGEVICHELWIQKYAEEALSQRLDFGSKSLEGKLMQ
jgi:hypothetical protein